MDLINLEDLKKNIIVPPEYFEPYLEMWDWTHHQVARGELPTGFISLEQFQLGCVCSFPVLWCQTFLRDPDDPLGQTPWQFFPDQKESLENFWNKDTIHGCGAETGKTREIVCLCMYYAFNFPGGSGLVGSPKQKNLNEIIRAIETQFRLNPDLKSGLVKHEKKPIHIMFFKSGFQISFCPSGPYGEAYRGEHAKTFVLMDEAAKNHHALIWDEFHRAMMPSCIEKIYSVPDGRRDTNYFKMKHAAMLGQSHMKYINFSKENQPEPFWSAERKKKYITLYGGETSSGYLRNVRGQDGEPVNGVFPAVWLDAAVKEIWEYRCLKIQSLAEGVYVVRGLSFRKVGNEIETIEELTADIPAPQFNLVSVIRSAFAGIHGENYGGADLGMSMDPSEIIIKQVRGRMHRTIARVHLENVTYDIQCGVIDTLDDIFVPVGWGVDYGNAGSAVVQIMQGVNKSGELNYPDKDYENRMKGYQFKSSHIDIDEDGNTVTDHENKPVKVSLKHLATKTIQAKMMKQETEYPCDPDLINDYRNHTSTEGSREPIYSKDNDHLIDADRVAELRILLQKEEEDIFA